MKRGRRCKVEENKEKNWQEMEIQKLKEKKKKKGKKGRTLAKPFEEGKENK